MNILIQNLQTGLYLTQDHQWSSDTTQAIQFLTEQDAIRYSIQHKLKGTQVVIFLNGNTVNYRFRLDEPDDLR